ncbi:hypothetical protein RSK20926_11479 [Roseobacter sp. SK209-2-6]|nr:hypothetical protein RSK20926_11479 [Roseobacter sp. SK209-2-6]
MVAGSVSCGSLADPITLRDRRNAPNHRLIALLPGLALGSGGGSA